VGAQGRGFVVNQEVAADLANRGLTTEPDFRAVALDSSVEIRLLSQAPAIGATDDPGIQPSVGNLANEDDDTSAWDYGLTVGNLPSASNGVASVSPSATVEEAITVMLLNDYSQVAVMTGKHGLKGAISWKSIAKARHAKPSAGLSDVTIKPLEIAYTADLIQMLPHLREEEFVFVRGSDSSITGIVTVADVVEAYGQMASPFFMIGKIDQSLRKVIETVFDLEIIAKFCDPDGTRVLESFDQLTIGDYQRVLENPGCWENLGWPLDRNIFNARLMEIRLIRNNILHFNNDPLPGDVLSMLQNFVDILDKYGE
jgi:CBS domain-containing protein